MRYDTYCGLYCGGCEILLVNKKEAVKEVAKKRDMQPEDLICNGCKTDTVSVFCKSCKIKSCAKNKGVEYCFQCSDYPCKIISDFKNDEHPHHSIVFKNLNLIKRIGIEQWLVDQELRWSCRECGEKFSFYDDKCSSCGNTIRNCIEEERELEIV